MKGCLIAIVVVGVLCFLGLIVFIGLFIAAGTASVTGGALSSDVYHFQEVTVGGSYGAPKVVCIPVEGVIYGSSMSLAELSPAALITAQLKKAHEDDRVRGVILLVDSPGGGITASDILYREVREFRTGTNGRPVVACMMDMGTSGAYYVSVGTDHIVAHPTAITGSIGVMMPLFDVTGLMNKVGVRSESVTSGAYKDIGSPFAEKSAEQKRKERELLQSIVDAMHQRFVEVVAQGRKMEQEDVKALADGRIFTAQEALDLKLIDQIGYESDAVDAMKRLAGLKEVHLVQYRRILTMSDIFNTFAKGPELNVNVGQGLPALEGGRLMYLWTLPSSQDVTR